jgi:seryl-tRNA synthetase
LGFYDNPRFNAGELNMSAYIDNFCENLRAKLTNVETDMRSLKSKIESSAATAEQEVRTNLDATKRRIEQQRGKLEGAQGDLKKWALERKAVSDEMVAAWKDKLETARLQSRADKAERYATAAAALAQRQSMKPSKPCSNHGWRAETRKLRKAPRRHEPGRLAFVKASPRVTLADWLENNTASSFRSGIGGVR